jgi:hypothetical protein
MQVLLWPANGRSIHMATKLRHNNEVCELVYKPTLSKALAFINKRYPMAITLIITEWEKPVMKCLCYPQQIEYESDDALVDDWLKDDVQAISVDSWLAKYSENGAHI